MKTVIANSPNTYEGGGVVGPIGNHRNKNSFVHVIDMSLVSSSPLNPLNHSVREYIIEQIKYVTNNPNVTSVILTGGGGGHFSAGADLTEFASFRKSSSFTKQGKDVSLIDVVNAIENCPKPVVAAISGTCLGGGMELALACHYRVALVAGKKSGSGGKGKNKFQMGLPEVHVGVIPGAGGTQRLPRLIGLQNSIQLIITGQPITDIKKAYTMKLIDAYVIDEKLTTTTVEKESDPLFELATKWAIWAEVMEPLVRNSTKESLRLSVRNITESPPVAHGILHATSLMIPKKELGGDGMHAALEAIRSACVHSNDFQAGMQQETKYFLQTLQSQQGKARRHSFFAVRNAQKQISLQNELPNVSLKSIQQHPLLQTNPKSLATIEVGVVGAGTMGGGIALVLLLTGYKVYLVDVNEMALQKGLKNMHQILYSYVKKKRLTSQHVEHMISSLLIGTQTLTDLKNCTLVVEAIIENMNIKNKIFTQLNDITKPTCILLSNTSTLSIDTMAQVLDTNRQFYFAGWHFFSPAHVMKLVEIVVGTNTSSATILLLQSLTKKINKIGVVVGNCDGFCGNRMLKPYTAEMVLLLVENNTNQNGTTTTTSIEQIDSTMREHGMALGPFQISDLAGNDIGYNIRKERGWVRKSAQDPIPPNRPNRYTEVADDMVSQLGRLGQKVGKGWYDYDPTIQNGRKALVSKEMTTFITKYHQTNPSRGSFCSHREMSSQEIIERLLYPLVNEGFKILEEQIARCPSDIDVVWLYGYGWPVYKGGPMYWADHIVTLPVLLRTLQTLSNQFPCTEHYIPSKLLVKCVQLQLTVEKYYQQGLHKKGTKKTNYSKL